MYGYCLYCRTRGYCSPECNLSVSPFFSFPFSVYTEKKYVSLYKFETSSFEYCLSYTVSDTASQSPVVIYDCFYHFLILSYSFILLYHASRSAQLAPGARDEWYCTRPCSECGTARVEPCGTTKWTNHHFGSSDCPVGPSGFARRRPRANL